MYDLIIKGGTIVDGTGAASFRGDLAISQGKIVAVGTVSDSARQVIDGSGGLSRPASLTSIRTTMPRFFGTPT